MLGKSMPTQEKLVVLAELLDTSAEQLRYGRYSEKTLMISNADGSETQLTIAQQQFFKHYLALNSVLQKLVSDLVGEMAS